MELWRRALVEGGKANQDLLVEVDVVDVDGRQLGLDL